MRTRSTPRRGKYDPGIKLLAVRYLHEGKTVKEVQNLLRSSVHCRTIQRWKALYLRTYSVVRDPSTYEKLGRTSILTSEDLDFMLELMNEDPTLYLDEYRKALYEETGNWVAISTIFRDLKIRLGISRKKTRTVHPNQDPIKRASFLYTVGGLRPDMLVFLDESSIAERSLKRDFARSKVGTRTKRVPWSSRGKRYSLLPAIFSGGVLAMACQEGSFKRNDFEFLLEHQLLPLMNPYPFPNSVLIMDNCSIHHGGRIAELAEARGVRLLYLPAYSPDFNPIEKAFAILKAHLRRTQLMANTPVEEKCEALMDLVWELFSEGLMEELWAACGYWIC